MSDRTLTKLTGAVIAAMRDQVAHLVESGLVEPDKLRLTIEARRTKAKELVDAGMSQRQAAKALGVPRRTLRDDVGGNRPESGPKPPTSPPAKSRKAKPPEAPPPAPAADDDDPLDDMRRRIANVGAVDACCMVVRHTLIGVLNLSSPDLWPEIFAALHADIDDLAEKRIAQ